jgi:hypothetical protein
MAKVDLRKTVYNRDQFSRVVGGREFTTFIVEDEAAFSVQDFFEQYDNLFLSIPVFGDTNTHEYLVRRSSELVGFQRTTEDIQPLLDEISNLRDQLLQTRQENINLQIEAAGGGVASELNDQFNELLAALGQEPEISVNIDLPSGDGTGEGGASGFTLIEDTIKTTISAAGVPRSSEIAVFENDEIAEGKVLTFLGIATQPQFGTAVVVNAQNGTIRYTPNANAPTGTRIDQFTYKVRDEQGVENTGFVSVDIENVAASNQPPIANDDVINVSVDVDGTINANTINILANDVDPDSNEPLFFDKITTLPKYGTLEVLDPEVGIVQYRPNKRAPNGERADMFEYKIFDVKGSSATGKVYVNIRNRYITYTTAGDDQLNVTIRVSNTEDPNNSKLFEDNILNVLENDEGLDVIFDGIVERPEYGTVTATADGIVTYIPRIGVRSSGEIDLNAWFTPGAGVEPILEDSFTYRAKNNRSGVTDIATVSVRINVVGEDEQPVLDEGPAPGGKKDTTDDSSLDASGRPQEPEPGTEVTSKKEPGSGGGSGRGGSSKTYNSSADGSGETSSTSTFDPFRSF